eukprot:g54775.t1
MPSSAIFLLATMASGSDLCILPSPHCSLPCPCLGVQQVGNNSAFNRNQTSTQSKGYNQQVPTGCGEDKATWTGTVTLYTNNFPFAWKSTTLTASSVTSATTTKEPQNQKTKEPQTSQANEPQARPKPWMHELVHRHGRKVSNFNKNEDKHLAGQTLKMRNGIARSRSLSTNCISDSLW